jgi:hypothetical protein
MSAARMRAAQRIEQRMTRRFERVAPARHEALYWPIYFSVQRIVPAVEELPLPSQEAVMRQLVRFRRLMTAKVTVGPNTPFPSEPERRSFLRDVSRGANRLVSALEDGYRRRYPLAPAPKRCNCR